MQTVNGTDLLAALLGFAVGWLLHRFLFPKAHPVARHDRSHVVVRDVYRGSMRRDLLQEAKAKAAKDGWQ